MSQRKGKLSRFSHGRDKYVDFKVDGRMFPSWVLANFPQYKLPDIIRHGKDPCNETKKTAKLELRKYQDFFGKYMDYNGPYRTILIYHGLGSGKTISAINIYNVLYNYTSGWNVYLLIKASLRDATWMKDLRIWIQKEDESYRMKNIKFVHYDAPNADKQFFDRIKESDSSKKNLYVFDEIHLFIGNVYSNIGSKSGRKAQKIYDYIVQDLEDNDSTRVVCMSATPAVNKPFELSLLFNLLRPNIFPKSEDEFNKLFVSGGVYKTINKKRKNQFQRRIMGLVSYYYGATPDRYAQKTVHYVDVRMSNYQEDIYSYYEDLEAQIAKRNRLTRGSGGTGEMYKSYTRQACNFTFPAISQEVTGEGRPRPNKYRLNEREAQKVDEKGMQVKREKETDKFINVGKYLETLKLYITSFEEWMAKRQDKDRSTGNTIEKEVDRFNKKYSDAYKDPDIFDKFCKTVKSEALKGMIKCSKKMVIIILNMLRSKGPTLVYSNYVMMEGFQILKVYLRQFGFRYYVNSPGKSDGKSWAEYHGGINKDDRVKALRMYNKKENIKGDLIKLIMISKAGAEGISLMNCRQVHIMEPYWQEVIISQVIGRAIRQCSHKDLPLDERYVDVYRYKSVRAKSKAMDRWTTDEYIENGARNKNGLIQSFLDSMKEVAIDCKLYKAHNMIAEEYKCFQFDEKALFDKPVGPTYKEDIYDDSRLDNGSNSLKSKTIKVKVMKIQAVHKISKDGEEDKYSEPVFYWLNHDTSVIYDYELKYQVGKVMVDDDGLPFKLNKHNYLVNYFIPIPKIK